MERPKLPRVDAETQRLCALLAEEVATWPQVTTRPMFGLLALYRGRTIFAALPRTRAAGTPHSLLIKLPDVQDARLAAGQGPGASWSAFAVESQADMDDALAWLGRAYERARSKRHRGR